MRRGHPGAGGWRGENQRHFRPRGSGTPNFRPSRPFGLLDAPRYPPPGPRQFRGPRPYGSILGHPDNIQLSEHHDRNKFRPNNLTRSQDRGYHNRERQTPYKHQLRQNDNDHGNSYGESNFYKKQNQCHVNNMGDIDHRRQHPISPWANPPAFENRQYYDDHRSPHKTPRHYNVSDDLPDYSGHRPPSSDHYTTTTNNNSQYAHSVDDTVDIVRKRLQNRDKQQGSDSTMSIENQNIMMDEDLRKPPKETYQNVPQEQPVKKKAQRQKQNIKLNCDKMKNKIVHQLFKMDKMKIHKLMDDPSSSHKFEYAISSLITEGQNSLNRHRRSVAEKSLCSSSDFIQDDSNTIYEDTFMKQMQGVLDPQDTVLLEDIKPLVMAELSRVLQLDDYQFELMQDHTSQSHGIHNQTFQSHLTFEEELQDQEMGTQNPNILTKDEPYQYYDDVQNAESFSEDNNSSFDQNHPSCSNYNNVEIIPSDIDQGQYDYEFESKLLFERRPASRMNKSKDTHSEKRQSRSSIDKAFGYQNDVPNRENNLDLAQRQSRSSIDKAFEYQQDVPNRENNTDLAQPVPLFDPNIEQLSEDEDDPFAEFDKQYHVAVDHNFIENENASRPPSPIQSVTSTNDKSSSLSRSARNSEISYGGTDNETKKRSNTSFSTSADSNKISRSNASSNEIEREIDAQLQNMAQSPVKLFSFEGKTNEKDSKFNINTADKEAEDILEKENQSTSFETHTTKTVTPEEPNSKRENKQHAEKEKNSTPSKSILQSNTRKRSTDQKPSHRKEKRKRSSQSESQEAAKSIINMFYVNNDNKKDTLKVTIKKSDSTDKTYSDKYVKRKESHKKVKEKDTDTPKTDESRKHNNTSSSHSNVSPKDNQGSETPSKSDLKTKLKPIDIFGAQIPKKGSMHQAHRNTASTPQTAKSPDDKPKPIIPALTSFARKLSKRHIGTQVILKLRNKECQTTKRKSVVKETQTDPVSVSLSKNVATNPLERMKEIDMEIQVLLEEKFKLYNSLETKAATVPIDSMPSLSMRVFNFNTEEKEVEKSADSEDAIVDDFTSIPTEELEQIALESFPDEKTSKSARKNRRQRVVEIARKSSASPTTRRLNKKVKSPNISLIEQIITDDRPIEDIISLDDLESTPSRSKRKHSKPVPKKKYTKRTKSSKIIQSSKSTVIDSLSYDIKECSVIIERIDISYYLRSKPLIISHDKTNVPISEVQSVDDDDSRSQSEEFLYPVKTEITPEVIEKDDEIHTVAQASMVQVVEDVVNDLQFDMLDVSEDIVIGDNYEVKPDDKVKEAITEEIILDNSQSSIEDVPEPAGTDNECKTYDYSTNENLRRDAITITGNADAVLAIECIDNDFIAACLDGNVYHFNGDGLLLNTLRGTNQAVTCLTIVQEKYGTTVYTGSLDSRIRYYDLETGMEKGPECNVLSPIQTMDRAWDTVFVGTRTGFVLQFECKNNMLIPVSTVKFSEQSILALRAMKEGPRKVLLVAARSENVVTIKDAQTGLLLRTLQGPKMSVYTLLFEDGKVYCGTSSHSIHVFDYSSGSHVGSHEGGKGAVCLRASGGLLFAGCYDGCVYVYREGEARPLAQLRGPSLMLLSLAIQGTKIIAGYKDRGLYIWKMPLAIVQEMIL